MGVGRGAAENTVGADIIGALNIDVDGASVRKGFLAQAKMAGSDGLYFRQTGVTATGGMNYSHASRADRLRHRRLFGGSSQARWRSHDREAACQSSAARCLASPRIHSSLFTTLPRSPSAR